MDLLLIHSVWLFFQTYASAASVFYEMKQSIIT